MPFGYWQFSVTASDYDYHQTVAGAVEDYQYSGESQNLGMQLSRVLHRNGTQKTVLTYDVQARRSRNYINDTEIRAAPADSGPGDLGCSTVIIFLRPHWMLVSAGNGEPAGLVHSRHRRKSSVRQRRSVRSCR